MTYLYYDPARQRWHHPEQPFRFGTAAAAVSAAAHSFRFRVRAQDGRLGPLIGILTSGTAEGKLFGDFSRFTAIQKALQKQGGISFVFSPYGMKDHHIFGHVCLPDDRWYKCRMPYPDVVYNRVPYRSHERTSILQEGRQMLRERAVPLFNPCFFSKWEAYAAFQRNPELQSFLLPSSVLLHPHDLLQIPEGAAFYVKRSDAAKGRHLFWITRNRSGLLLRAPGKPAAPVSPDDLGQLLSDHTYMIQTALNHDRHEGCKYDLRAAIHMTGGRFRISGVGVRLAAPGEIVTHVPNGGSLLPPSALKRPLNLSILEQVAAECGKSLCEAFGHVREFSLDLGVDQGGRYFIYEANSKPMTFDEPQIAESVMEQLLTIFAEEAGFLQAEAK